MEHLLNFSAILVDAVYRCVTLFLSSFFDGGWAADNGMTIAFAAGIVLTGGVSCVFYSRNSYTHPDCDFYDFKFDVIIVSIQKPQSGFLNE
jgi:hypothetical protein